MPNNYLSVLYEHIIQVENTNVGLKGGGGHKHTIAPNQKSGGGGDMPPLPPDSYASDNDTIWSQKYVISSLKLAYISYLAWPHYSISIFDLLSTY